MRLGGYVDISTIETPGKVSFTIFFASCDFRCPWCQNSSLIPPSSGREVSLEYLMERIRRNKPFIDGVHITGGECTIQADGLRRLCEAVKGLGLEVYVNTNGSRPKVIKKLIDLGLIDQIALDLKAPLKPEIYGRMVGLIDQGRSIVSLVKESLEICLGAPITLEVRTTIVPTLNDREEYVSEIARAVKGCHRYILAQYRPEGDILDPSFKNMKPPTRERLMVLAKEAVKENLKDTYIRTREHGLEKL